MQRNGTTVAGAILDELLASSRCALFGIPGGAISSIYDALIDRPQVACYHTHHESGAVFMAMGYSWATGQPGVVLTTAGPGVTNALTGIASAFADGVPVICISGEVPRAAFGRGAVQEGSAYGVDTVGLVRRIVKLAAQITRPATAATLTHKALATACSGRRGPVFLSLPLDIGRTQIDGTHVHGGVRTEFAIDEPACQRAADALMTASHPLLLLGNGARAVPDRGLLVSFAERLATPVIVTTKAKGVFPEEHPLYLGVFGLGGHENVSQHLQRQRPDVLVAGGTSFNDIATNSWSDLLAPTRTQIHIDIDAAQIGKNYRSDLGLLGPLDQVLARMAAASGQVRRTPDIRPLRDVPLTLEPGRDGRLSAQQALATIAATCPPDTAYTCDFGEYMSAAINVLRVGARGDFLISLGLGSMGSGIGSAIGYQIGAPGRRVVGLCGDGAFLMYGNEIATAVKYALPVTLCVFNDGRFNMVHHGHQAVYGRGLDFSYPLPDIAGMAVAMGADGRRIETAEQLAAALVAPLVGPLVLDVRIDPEVVLAGSQRNAALKHFTAPGGD